MQRKLKAFDVWRMLDMADTARPEQVLIDAFRISTLDKRKEPDLPHFDPETDLDDYEVTLAHGRVDILLCHVDGSMTVIEAKNGDMGETHVAQGIGQVCFYAAQLALRGQVSKVHRALLWSGMKSFDADQRIMDACNMAGVIPIYHGPMHELRDGLRQMRSRAYEEEPNASRE